MKPKFLIIILFFIAIFLASCNTYRELVADSPDITITEKFDSTSVAIFSFEKSGRFEQNNIGLIAADIFSNSMFLTGDYNIVDRTYINDLFIQKNLRSTLNFDKEELGKLGLELGANYIVLGKIIKTENPDFFSDDQSSTFWLEIRVINTQNKSIAAIAQCRDNFKCNEIEAISILANRIVKEL